MRADHCDACRAMGWFVVVDKSSNSTVGAGMIVSD
jgi:sulfate adenylyltransferase subunit 1 (EFTu-like GTPase family)